MAGFFKIVATESGKIIGDEMSKKFKDLQLSDIVKTLETLKDFFDSRRPTLEEVLQFKSNFCHDFEFKSGLETKRITTAAVDSTICLNKARLLLGFGNAAKGLGVEKLGVEYFPFENNITVAGLVNFATPRNPSMCLLLKAKEKEWTALGQVVYKPFAEQKLTTYVNAGYVTPAMLFNLYKGEDSLGVMYQQYITKSIMLRASADQTISSKDTNVSLGVGKDISVVNIAFGATASFPGTETAAGGNAEGGNAEGGNAEGGTVPRIGEDGNYYITVNGQISTDYKGTRYMIKGSVRPNDGDTKIGLAWATIG